MRDWMKAALAAAIVAAPGAAAPVPGDFTSLLVFGDSLSDPGRFGPDVYPYEGMRFSTGEVWAERVGAEFESAGRAAINLAVGGATVGEAFVDDPVLGRISLGEADLGAGAGVLRLINLQGQIGALTDRIAGGLDIGANPLAAVWLGANDLFAISAAGLGPSEAIAGAVGAAQKLVAGIEQIAALDPAIDDFLVFGLPDFGSTPAFLGNAGASVLSSSYNAALLGGFASLEAKGIDIAYVDTASLLAQAVADPSAFGLTNVTEACIRVVACATGAVDRDSFLFVDDVHPTAPAHVLVADLAVSSARAQLAPVPLPAGLPLALIGLGGLVIVRRSRR